MGAATILPPLSGDLRDWTPARCEGLTPSVAPDQIRDAFQSVMQPSGPLA